MSIAELTAGSSVTRQALTKHLHVMETSGLISGTRRGRECRWQLDRSRFDEARHYLEMISTQWADTLERLRKFVESPEEPGMQ